MKRQIAMILILLAFILGFSVVLTRKMHENSKKKQPLPTNVMIEPAPSKDSLKIDRF